MSACSRINRVIKVLSAACISVGRPGRSSMSPVVFRCSPAKDRSAAIARGGAASSAGAWPLLASGRGRVLVRPNARHSVVQSAGSRVPPFSGKPPPKRMIGPSCLSFGAPKSRFFRTEMWGNRLASKQDIAWRRLWVGTKAATAIRPDLSGDIAESIPNVDQRGDAPQDRRLAATLRTKEHRDPGRWNREHSA